MNILIRHSAKDKYFVRSLANDLDSYGLNVWFDEYEEKSGEPLSRKMRMNINKDCWLIIILSENSVNSSWLQIILNDVMAFEIENWKIFILSILLDDSKIPFSLRDKLCIDFSKEYIAGFRKLLEQFGLNEYSSKLFEFPQNIRLKKNEKAILNFRYNLFVKSISRNIQKLVLNLYGLDSVEDLRIVALDEDQYNIYLHCNCEIGDTILEEYCRTKKVDLIKLTKYKFD
jgi:hypothetical protein